MGDWYNTKTAALICLHCQHYITLEDQLKAVTEENIQLKDQIRRDHHLNLTVDPGKDLRGY